MNNTNITIVATNALDVAYGGTLLTLVFMMYVVGALTGWSRKKRGGFKAPEDAPERKLLDEEAEDVLPTFPLDQRYNAVHRNTIENTVPWFLSTIFFYLMFGSLLYSS